ncbi:MAG: DUF1871 family protein [Tissierellia bacterium]|nr:DUF1871 family protein [Tissierellia bacterium]
MNRIEKYNIIKQEIDKWDPVYLYKMECPPNEYDLEVTKISSKIEELKDVNSLARHIYNVFLEMFGEETQTKTENIMECQKIVQNILDKINK